MAGGRRVPVAVACAILLVALVGGVFLATRDDNSGPETAGPQPAAGSSGDDPFAPDAEGAPASAADAGTPEEAATGFLSAEAADDFATSFSYLAEDDREFHVALAGWEEAHSEQWDVTGFTLQEATRDGDDTTVTAQVELAALLDPALGLIPADAVLSLPVREEPGGWRVAFADSSYDPTYLDDAGADDAVRQWAESRQQCQTAAQWDGGLLGASALRAQLCGAEGAVEVGPVGTIDELTDASPYLNDFGGAAADWARVVPVTGAVALDAVAAPVGDRWVVIGVNPPAEGG